jgi:hypothetical protein
VSGPRDVLDRLADMEAIDTSRHPMVRCCGRIGWEAIRREIVTLREVESELLAALKALHGDCPGWTVGTDSAHSPSCNGFICGDDCPIPVPVREECEVCRVIAKAEGR